MLVEQSEAERLQPLVVRRQQRKKLNRGDQIGSQESTDHPYLGDLVVRLYVLDQGPHDQFHLAVRHALGMAQPPQLMDHVHPGYRAGRLLLDEILCARSGRA